SSAAWRLGPSLRRWKKLRAAARQPIYQQPDPFAGRHVGATQAGCHGVEGNPQIRRPRGAVVDRIGLDRESRLAECADRPWHMIRGGDEQPAPPRLRHHQPPGELSVLGGGAGLLFEEEPPCRYAEALAQRGRAVGLPPCPGAAT